MGIFTRFTDIISSNINAMLDKAEDPEKMIKLMIREMEDTLVELKASCASVIAESKKMQRRLDEINARKSLWEDRVSLAVEKGRDDLAREALVEKKRFSKMVQVMDGNLTQQFPQIMGFAGDLIFKAMDMPYADEIADRIKAMLPPEIQQQMPGKLRLILLLV